MIRILFFSDTHLGFDYPIRSDRFEGRRGPDFFANFDRVLDDAIRQKVDLVIHGGDLFYRSRVPKKIVHKTYDRLFEFAEHQIPIVIVPGNHERSELPQSLLMQHYNIHVFSQPECFRFKLQDVLVDVAGFPFFKGDVRAAFPDLLQQIQFPERMADFRLLCLHQAVEGAQVGPQNFTFRHRTDTIRMDSIPDLYDAVLSGHIHRAQVLMKTGTTKALPVVFCGSVERTSFAERTEQKGYYILSWNEKESAKLPILEFCPLPARPMVDWELPATLACEADLVAFVRQQLPALNQRSVIRLKAANTEVLQLFTAAFRKAYLPADCVVQFPGFRKAL